MTSAYGFRVMLSEYLKLALNCGFKMCGFGVLLGAAFIWTNDGAEFYYAFSGTEPETWQKILITPLSAICGGIIMFFASAAFCPPLIYFLDFYNELRCSLKNTLRIKFMPEFEHGGFDNARYRINREEFTLLGDFLAPFFPVALGSFMISAFFLSEAVALKAFGGGLVLLLALGIGWWLLNICVFTIETKIHWLLGVSVCAVLVGFFTARFALPWT